MFRLKRWSIQQSDSSSGRANIEEVSVIDAQDWLRGPDHGSFSHDLSWSTELIIFETDEQLFDKIDVIQSLIDAFGHIHPGAIATSDTIKFNSHQPVHHDREQAIIRTYSVSDNVFGICWQWNAARSLTKGFMYGLRGEGFRQMADVIDGIEQFYVLRKSPLFIGLLALRAEVREMTQWIAFQGEELSTAHVHTGHHSYANHVRQANNRQVDLTTLSCDVCGLAVNISTSALCLRILVKFANFILEECEDVLEQMDASPRINQSLVEKVRAAQVNIRCQTQNWKRCAENLFDEAEAWKHKASILVQTVFTLVARKDQDISIQIASDSRTLAEKATRDSTSMKAIAAVTMFFLPGTFVASLFAMPMFDWNAPPNESINKHFWIYWVVTIPLTLAVVGAWLSWTNRDILFDFCCVRVLRKNAHQT